MEFRIADTFTQSLARLTAAEQKLVKQTAFDAQVSPSSTGLSFHKLDKSKDKNFWSLRAGSDIRIIVHKTEKSLLFCYVDHHDKAYAWAERRRLEVHPRTGAAQLVVLPESTATEPPTFAGPMGIARIPRLAHLTSELLLRSGIPESWIPTIHNVSSEDELLEVAELLPAEAAEALIGFAVGLTPVLAQPANDITIDAAFDHPDAMRRFRLMGSPEELRRALDYPWDKWIVFLHPEQRKLVQGEYNGSIKVSGSAGTGKTVVALHRAAHLARTHESARILLTTLTKPLANALQNKLNTLLAHEPRLSERIDVHSLNGLATRLLRLYGRELGSDVAPATPGRIKTILEDGIKKLNLSGYTDAFLYDEWTELVDARQLKTWEEYSTVPRLGRKTRLSTQRRETLWELFAYVNSTLAEQNRYTEAAIFTWLAGKIGTLKNPPFDYIIVDEAQDVSFAQMRFLAALGAHRSDTLCFCGDLGQRIFQLPFSWKSLGVDIRGRSYTLRVNYRTSHQIRMQADKLLEAEITDADGNVEKRANPVSAFNGPNPEIVTLASQAEEIETVALWLTERREEGVDPREIAVFVRSEDEYPRAVKALEAAEIPFTILDADMEVSLDKATLAIMHLAKGLEFKSVVVMACDSDVIPSRKRIESMGDDADMEDIYVTERQLLYVACTRARDNLMISGVEPVSEFLDDLLM
ncbi:UvrD-helicase domain-containing protein [Desulfovibrio sp. OttesenSCG-928-A18]|nr:UvrD-helicase domain-containing protein [Desulfovibrio sp. OttesenSCG-928-A18]